MIILNKKQLRPLSKPQIGCLFRGCEHALIRSSFGWTNEYWNESPVVIQSTATVRSLYLQELVDSNFNDLMAFAPRYDWADVKPFDGRVRALAPHLPLLAVWTNEAGIKRLHDIGYELPLSE